MGKHPSSNTEHRTSNELPNPFCWMLGVGCSMLDVKFFATFPPRPPTAANRVPSSLGQFSSVAVMKTWPLVLRACSSNGRKPLRRFTSSSPITSSISSTGARAVDAGEKFRLRHFQRDGQRAFLAFAAELRGGFFVEQQLQIVAVRPDQRGAIRPFAVARLREFDGEILFHARLVFDAQFLGVVGNAAIRQPRQRGKFRRRVRGARG